jgi:AcrR family transcriptional regulator
MNMNSASTQPIRQKELNALKEEHKNAALIVGLRLCFEQGVADLDMKQVAQQAQISRATLYRYFPSKKAFVYEILRQQVNLATQVYHAERQTFVGTGFEKFSLFVAQIVSAYRHFPDLFRLMGMVDFYYGTQDSAQDLVQLYQELFNGLLIGETPHTYLLAGQADGSVSKTIHAKTYTATVIASLISLIEQIAVNKTATQHLYGIENADQLVETAAQALLDAARSQ